MNKDEANIATVVRFYEAIASRDLETILEVTDPDIVVRQSEELPWGGEYRGQDDMGNFFLQLLAKIDSQIEHDAIYAAGDHVVQIGRTLGTIEPYRTPFDVKENHVLRLENGRIVEWDIYIDTPKMLKALGITPPE